MPGDDIDLKLDINVQATVEETLAEGLAVARDARDREFKKHFLAQAGAAVALDPRDGSVLAMASNPTYNPSIYVDGSVAEFKRLQDPALHAPLNDRASEGLYAPGLDLQARHVDRGVEQGPHLAQHDGRRQGLHQDRQPDLQERGLPPHGRVRLDRALTVSSDVFYYSLGERFWSVRGRYGETAIQDTAHDLGLGEGIGRVPTPEIRKRLHDSNPKAFPNGGWFPGDNANLAIGQGEMAITPLQLGNAYATFANGGTLWAPRLGTEIIDANGTKVRDVAPRAVRRLDLPPSLRNPILSGLTGVVKDPKGTAARRIRRLPATTDAARGQDGHRRGGRTSRTRRSSPPSGPRTAPSSR